MKAKLLINEKEYEAEISDEQFQELEKSKHQTGYERVMRGKKYYYIEPFGSIMWYSEAYNATDDRFYNIANYYSDETVAENNARADRLYRQLRRFAVENRQKKLDWNNEDEEKWCIFFEHSYGGLVVDYFDSNQHFGLIYFDTKETAHRAIDTFKDELLWYFAEYKDSL